MITINLKSCCYSCNYPDIQVENCDFPASYLKGEVFFSSQTDAIISCAHARVCKNYIESEDE